MFKITIMRIDASLLTAVESVGKIEYIDRDSHTFTASFDGCKIKGKAERIVIRNPEKHTYLSLSKTDFEEVCIT